MSVSDRIRKNEHLLDQLTQQLGQNVEAGYVTTAIAGTPRIAWRTTVLIKLYSAHAYETLARVANGADYYRGCVLLVVPFAESSKIRDVLCDQPDLLNDIEILDPLTDRDAILAQLQEEEKQPMATAMAMAIQYGQEAVPVAVAIDSSVEDARNNREEMNHLLAKLDFVRIHISRLNGDGPTTVSIPEKRAIVAILSVVAKDAACRPAIMAGFAPIITTWKILAQNDPRAADMVAAMQAVVSSSGK